MDSTEGTVPSGQPSSRAALRTWRLGPELAVETDGSPALEAALDEVFGVMASDASQLAPVPAEVLQLGLVPSARGGRLLLVDGLQMVRIALRASLAPTLEAMLVGWSVRTRTEHAALHAGAVEAGGRAVLLVGGKGSGKSTLSAYLGGAPDGPRYLGDELSFVRYDSLVLDAFPKAATLKRGSFSLFPETETHLDLIRGLVRYHLPPRRASSSSHAVPVGMTIFPRWSSGAREVIATELDPAEVSLLLVSQSFGGLERDPRMLPLVGRLAELPAFRVEYPDSASAAAAIATLAQDIH